MIPILASLLLSLIIALFAAWGTLALWYQTRPGLRTVCAGLWALFGLACVGALWRGHLGAGVAIFALAHGLFLIWWRSLRPSNHREWSDDVAQTVGGKLDGNVVTLDKVRDFVWRTNTDYTPRWVTRRYDLARLHSLDMIVSYWARPSIAHMLISFGFGENDYVVFSVEIRRQKGPDVLGGRRILQGVRARRHRRGGARHRAPAHQCAAGGHVLVPHEASSPR